MFDTVVRPGAIVDRAILDKEVTVGPGAIVGEGSDLTVPNRLSPSHLTTGITIVGKRAVLPRGVRIGRNVRVDPDVRATDFPGRMVESGATISRGDGRPRGRGRAAAPTRAAAPAAADATMTADRGRRGDG
jgi:glucose-1-phosphate adenylyltransferase